MIDILRRLRWDEEALKKDFKGISGEQDLQGRVNRFTKEIKNNGGSIYEAPSTEKIPDILLGGKDQKHIEQLLRGAVPKSGLGDYIAPLEPEDFYKVK